MSQWSSQLEHRAKYTKLIMAAAWGSPFVSKKHACNPHHVIILIIDLFVRLERDAQQ